MTILDRIRIHRTSLVFDYWMDVEGVPTRGRAQRRAELRANLVDASEQIGFPAARRRLGLRHAVEPAGQGPDKAGENLVAASLHGSSAVLALLPRSAQQGRNFRLMVKLNGPLLPPRSGRPATQAVILLHGYGADGSDLISLGQHWGQLLPDAMFIAPNAPEVRCLRG